MRWKAFSKKVERTSRALNWVAALFILAGVLTFVWGMWFSGG